MPPRPPSPWTNSVQALKQKRLSWCVCVCICVWIRTSWQSSVCHLEQCSKQSSTALLLNSICSIPVLILHLLGGSAVSLLSAPSQKTAGTHNTLQHAHVDMDTHCTANNTNKQKQKAVQTHTGNYGNISKAKYILYAGHSFMHDYI